MSSGNLGKRIDRLDDRFYDFSFPRGTTVIDYNCFTAQEQMLIEQWWKLQKKYDDNVPEPVLKENRALLDALFHVVWGRTFDAWGRVVEGVYCRSDLDKFIFWTRFFWFLDETSWIIDRGHLEDKKIQELFGDDPKWYSDDDDAIPDTDPRWAQLHEYMERIEAEHKAKMEKKREEEKEVFARCIRSGEAEEEQK